MADHPVLEWRAVLGNGELNALHARCFGHPVLTTDWLAQLDRHSLGWVTTRRAGQLVGFVNVVWDGGVHAFLLDLAVAPTFRRQGLARLMVEEAVRRADAAGCHWLHVDFEPELRDFYIGACGFRPTDAGVWGTGAGRLIIPARC